MNTQNKKGLTFRLRFHPPGFTHYRVLQQRDVSPLLFRDNAVADPKGNERLKHLPYSTFL